MAETIEQLARSTLLMIAVCHPLHFENYRRDLRAINAQGQMVQRFTTAFVRYFSNETECYYLGTRY